MACAIQLEIFESNDEISLLRREIAIVRQQSDNVRKGLFKRHSEIQKEMVRLKQDVETLKGKERLSLQNIFA